MSLNRTELVTITCTIAVGTMFLMAMKQVAQSNDNSLKAMCRSDMIAAEVSKLDRGIAVDLHKFTNGRSAEEMRDLPQCISAVELVSERKNPNKGEP